MDNTTTAGSNNRGGTVELLREMHRNVTMGSDTLSQVVSSVTDKGLMTNITAQLEKYSDFTKKTEDMLSKRHASVKDTSLMKKAMTKGGIAINTAFDSSNSNIAQMIAKGTSTGVTNLEITLEKLKNRGVDSEVEKLCDDIISFERHEADAVKRFIR